MKMLFNYFFLLKIMKEGKYMNAIEILQTEESKLNFLKGLIRLAKVDGVIDSNEIAFYKQAAVGLGMSDNSINEIEYFSKNDENISFSFSSNEEKMFFLIQAVQLCWMDSEYVESEKQEIRIVCKELGISEEALIEVENWVKQGIEWNKSGDRLLYLC